MSVKLVFNPVCPFAHRVYLALLEKKVPHELILVDLWQKSEQFTNIYQSAIGADPSSNGKVPVLIHGDIVLAESDLISWYIAETFESGTQLIPGSPLERFKLRRFLSENPSKLISAFYSIMGWAQKSEEEKQKIKMKINSTLEALNDAIEGPYALGNEFSLADLLIYPWLDRWVVNETCSGIELKPEWKKLHDLKENVGKREATITSTKDLEKDFYVRGYEKYMK